MSYVEGTVADIVYRNEENGYTVLDLDCEGNLVVCVGNIPLIQPGEYVRFYGGYTTHRTYGEQFKVVSMESKMPESDESIVLFLSGGLIKGVGEIIARRIVEQFHADSFSVIENNPRRLAQIKGISPKMADKIHEQYMGLQTIRGVILSLQNMGLSIKEAMAAYEVYGQSAAYLIEKNPYRLIEDVPGIGFMKADRIAAEIGMEGYASLRLESGLVHILKLKMEAGHTCFPMDAAVKAAAEFLQAEQQEVLQAAERLVGRGALAENTYNGVRAVALSTAYLAESYAAYRLVQLSKATPKIEVSNALVEGILKSDEMLSEEQERAVMLAASCPVCVITGGPGTGKTTILNQVLTIFEKSGIVTALAAPTGRAAKRMEKATLRPAKTIHRLLEFGAQPGEDISEYSRFARDEDNPIEADAVIIDETSMVDIFLLKNLLAALEPGTRLILTGDSDQLPSVGPGNVLKDIIASGQVPVAILNEVFRSQGNIALNAHKVNLGEKIDLFSAGDFLFLPTKTPEEALERTMRVYQERLEEGIPMDEIQIICPVKKGTIGVYNINKEIRERLNPRRVEKKELEFGDTVYREGDKIMQTVNNYNKEWYLQGTMRALTAGSGAFNGDIGRIHSIDPAERTLEILFDDDRLAEYSQNELAELEHAYAVTVHKSQGSEFDTVILPLFYGYSEFLTRNLLYTAITRAKRKMILIGSERTIAHMISNARVSRRFTALDHEIRAQAEMVERLAQGKENQGDEWDELFRLLEEDKRSGR